MHDSSLLFIELGAVVVGLAVLARVASRWGFSAIPLYLLAGLAFGNGGLLPLNLSKEFIQIGAEIGVLLLLFMLGLEYSGAELQHNLRRGLPAGLLDFALNFPPGLVTGLLLRWHPLAAVLLGGVTWISSSGVIAKVLAELRRLSCPETPLLLAVLVIEDLAMALYLPIVAVLLAGGGPARIALSVIIAVGSVACVLVLAIKCGPALSRFVAHESDEIILLTSFGTVLLVAGIAQRLQVSSAIGAFLVGIALSGPIAEQSHRLLAPLRDLFAATFFFFFGLQVNPASLLPVWSLAVLLGLLTAGTKILTGYLGTGKHVDHRGRLRAGAALVARGEFSIVIAGLGAGLQPQLSAVAAAYVLFLAVAGPLLARFVR
ncbi:MAG: cation/H(+) antiporter [Terriglobia bacterium]|nr:MAG: cation/H(+) antiporter [Terriglobia bacterium]